MPVPEAPMNHDDGPITWKHDVRAPGKIFPMEAEAESKFVGYPADDQLRFGSSAPDSRHDLASFPGLIDVRHRSAIRVEAVLLFRLSYPPSPGKPRIVYLARFGVI